MRFFEDNGGREDGHRCSNAFAEFREGSVFRRYPCSKAVYGELVAAHEEFVKQLGQEVCFEDYFVVRMRAGYAAGRHLDLHGDVESQDCEPRTQNSREYSREVPR